VVGCQSCIAMTWSEAFYAQSQSDFRVFQKLMREKGSGDGAFCHCLHFLQMATEKLAKSFMCLGQTNAPKPTHSAQVKFLQTIATHMSSRNRFKAFTNRDLSDFVRVNLPFAQAIQDLAPTSDMARLNAEYPWRTLANEIQCPCLFAYPQFNRTSLMMFANFIEHLLVILK